MATGYLVTLGDGVLDTNDAISGSQSTFDIAATLGAGSWQWTGVWDGDGQTYSNINDTGVYYEGTDGNVYFIPDTWFITSGSATVIDHPTYPAAPANGTVDGTAGDDVIDSSYTDGENEGPSSGNDTIDAAGGNDEVVGLRGNDSIFGGSGNDVIFGGQGTDTIDAGSDNDTVYGGGDADSIIGGSGTDTLYGGTGADNIDGGNNSDVIYGGLGDDTIVDTGGSLSDDTIFGGAGNDSIDGGGREDFIYGGSGSDTIEGGSGTDTIIGGGEDDVIYGGDDADVLIGDSGASSTGGSENLSWIAEGASGTSLDGAFVQNTGGMNVEVQVTNDGNATTLQTSNSTQYTEAGEPFATNSSLQLGGGAGPTSTTTFAFEADPTSGLTDTVENVEFRINDIDASGWTDIITVNAYDANGNLIPVTITLADPNAANPDTVSGNTITGGANNDTQSAAGGSALIQVAGPVSYIEIIYENGGTSGQALWITDVHFDTIPADQSTGNDQIYGGDGADVIDGEAGNDSLYGGTGNDSIDGGTGADYIDGGAGADTVNAGDGDDTIEGGTEGDVVYAGTGNDTIYGGPDASTNTLFGEAGDDVAFGGSGTDLIYGGADNDTLDGESGNDSLYGGTGNDQLIGDAGTDTMFGGDGADTFYGGTDADTMYGGDGDDLAFGGEGDDVFELWLGNDTAYGGTGADYIDGAQGDDILYGGDNDDIILGGSDVGNDILYGGSGNDSLSAGDGEDTLFGGTGDDTQFGAGGDDIFVMEDDFGNDTITGGETSETLGDILDASSVTTDLTLDLSTLQPGNPEMGTLSDGTSTATFEEIEAFFLGSGNDSVTGSSGDDQVATNSGQDTIDLGAGNDQLDLGLSGGGSDGEADVIILQDGSGNDTILNFDAPTPNGDGTFTGIDTFDVTDLHDAGGDSVTVDDVTVSDDGSGNALLTFPNGESVLLVGISPVDANDPNYLNAIGIPFRDGTVEGTAGDDVIDGAYLGDPDGDMVDANDAVLAGDTGDDDLIYGYGGNDTIDPGAGNDEAYGGSGEDQFIDSAGDDTLYGGSEKDTFDYTTISGNDTVVGGEVNDTTPTDSGDKLDAHDNVDNLTVTFTGDEAGTMTDGVDTVTFSEIEHIMLGTGADTIDASSSTVGQILDGGEGADTITGSQGDDYIAMGLTQDFSATDGDNDVLILTDGFGNDTIEGFEAPTPVGDGTFTGNDTVDVTALNDAGGDPVNTNDVTVTDDGSGNAVLTFPNGESVTLLGIAPADADDPFYLNAIGIPLPDGTVSGTAGSDIIDGSYTGDPDGDMVDNDDAILPGASGDDDLIEAGGGNDYVLAGAGNDTVFSGTGFDEVYGGEGSDILYGGEGSDSIAGGAGDDVAYGGTGDDTFLVADNDGSDTISGGEDLDGLDNDTLDLDESGSTQGVTVTFTGNEAGTYDFDGTTGTGTFEEIETIDATDYDDTLDASPDTSGVTLIGNAGTDVITGGQGNDSLSGGADADTFVVQDNFGDDTIIGGQTGNNYDTLDLSGLTNPVSVTFTGPGAGTVTDTVTGDTIVFSEIEQLILTDQADVVNATNDDGYTYIQTLGGDDSYVGSDGDDVVDEEIGTPNGQGNDTFFGGAGNDEIWAGTDDDTVFGGTGSDTLQGQEGNDSLYGGASSDTLVGESGNDLLDGGQSNDLLDGGTGNDTLDGGSAFDTLYGGDGDDTLDGGIANDTIDGGSGDDTIVVNDNFADDTFIQNEVIIGGETGETNGDTLDGSGLTQDVTVTMTGDEAGTITNGTGTSTFSEIEQIETGSGNDTFVGGAGADSISTNAGDDQLTVSDGDTADAGSGDDVIVLEDTVGGPGATITVTGGSGDETTGDTLQLGDLANLQDVLANATDDGTGSFSGSITLDDGTILNFSEIENIICFTPGTRIATPHGLRAIEDLKVGDMIVTRDHGLQPIRWIEARKVPAVDRFAPVRIRKGVLGGQERDLIVSPQHRVLFQGYRAELLFGETEVLVSAAHLVDGMDVTQDEGHEVTYIHMLFDQHEIIYAEGAPTESFHPGDIGFSAVGDAAREELFAIFPELRSDLRAYGNTARRCLKRHEAQLVRG